MYTDIDTLEEKMYAAFYMYLFFIQIKQIKS